MVSNLITDPRIADRSDCIMRTLLDKRAAESPARIFATFASDMPDWTYADLRKNVLETANGLAAVGVGQGAHVISWLPNGPITLRVWLAINYLGAIYVPMNVAYRGEILQHAIELSGAELMIADAEYIERLIDIETGDLKRVVVVGQNERTVIRELELISESALYGAWCELPDLETDIQPWDTQAIIFTSGTTGPSKAVLNSYHQVYSCATSLEPFTADQRLHHVLPMFHVSGITPVIRALALRSAIAMVERFSTATFWRDIRKTGATSTVIIGSMAPFLLNQAVSEDEKMSTIREVVLAPLTPESRELAVRIGARFLTIFSMTEVGVPLVSDWNPPKNGICGRPREGVQVRIVDENDCELPVGQVGELIIRNDGPWRMLTGYHKRPEATAQAWRNGWFHTGDACKVDKDGDYYYVDRIKDSIRRRGENISSFEVEVVVRGFPGVEDCAAIAVPSNVGEDDVLVVIQRVAEITLNCADLIAFLAHRMPHYMIPRYVKIVDQLPKTASQKVQKAILRAAGVTDDTWDRDAAGIRIGRDGVKVSA